MPQQHLNQNSQFTFSQEMSLGLKILQMPVLELAEWLRGEIDRNPALESTHSEDFQLNLHTSSKNEPCYQPSLFDYLMHQCKQRMQSIDDLSIAEKIIGNLNHQGFLDPDFYQAGSPDCEKQEIILKVIQSLDPPGIGALNVRESLLIQLEMQNKKQTAAYQIINLNFEDLLYNRILVIQKKLNISLEKINKAIQTDIAALDPYPGYRFHSEVYHPLIADLMITDNEDELTAEINLSSIPNLRLSSNHLPRKYFQKAKQMISLIELRHSTLRKIGSHLISKQAGFFRGEQKLKPLTIQEAAGDLGLHESTISRAVMHKYIRCSQGILPLRYFFNYGITSSSGEKVATIEVRKILENLILKENKANPLSDQELSDQLKNLGIPCTRRTVTKYRNQLKIHTALVRKKYFSY
jgi:RNA polymerase sigma-54 factor